MENVDMSEYRDYGPRLSSLETHVGALTVQVTNLQSGQTEQSHKLDRIIEKIGTPAPPLNWGWVMSGLITLGVVITLYTSPIIQINEQQRQQIVELREQQALMRERIAGLEVSDKYDQMELARLHDKHER